MHWLFLRGLAREQRHWGDFPEHFERLVAGSRVHCLDLPGAGTERGRPSPTNIEAIADDLRARWLDLRREHPGPWAILGMSLGGMVGVTWCAAHPDDFARIVLAGASAANLSRPWRRFDLRIVPTALTAMAHRDAVSREAGILSMNARLHPALDEVAARWSAFPPMERANVARQLGAAMRFRAPTHIDVPMLVLAGGRDPLADPSCSRLLASRFGAPLAIHPTAGHELALDAPDWVASQVATWIAAEQPAAAAATVRIEPLGPLELPLVVEPAAGADRSEDALVGFVAGRRAELEDRLTRHGAILLRGFDVDGARGFERVARAFEPVLQNDYLGTSPRNALTDYVFSASELPPYYPIPQHCEMSFVAHPPRRLFFSCLVPSAGAGGETPLADFRRVLADLPAEVRARFEAKGVRNVRNYAGPGGSGRFDRLDRWKLKRWDEMFGTTDPAAVARACAANGFDLTWKNDGRLRLVNVQPAVKKHPVTGEPVWFNHTQVFHLSAVPAEYRRIATRQGQLRYDGLARVADAMLAMKRRRVSDDDQAMHATFGDGTPIPDADMDAVRDAIWKNMVFFNWRKGDVLVIDNDAVAHGRMPYTGERVVAVAWA
jgi:pimeloyl-ACP methyl ester carboxylesterase/alpha-ketoglutarate-dependent taurine dioxygenase